MIKNSLPLSLQNRSSPLEIFNEDWPLAIMQKFDIYETNFIWSITLLVVLIDQGLGRVYGQVLTNYSWCIYENDIYVNVKSMKKRAEQINQVTQENVERKIISLRGKHVILDNDVAQLYGVETKWINEAVKNNPDKFPEGYLIELTADEWEPLKSKFSTSIKGGKIKPPKAFTEKSLYMLATILKSAIATKTTISIIETFSKVKEISKKIRQIPTVKENTPKHHELMHKTGELISNLIVPEELATAESEASIELNLSIVKFKYSLKKKKPK